MAEKSRLKRENGFITLDGHKYHELNWFGQHLFNVELRLLKLQDRLRKEKNHPLARVENRS